MHTLPRLQGSRGNGGAGEGGGRPHKTQAGGEGTGMVFASRPDNQEELGIDDLQGGLSYMEAVVKVRSSICPAWPVLAHTHNYNRLLLVQVQCPLQDTVCFVQLHRAGAARHSSVSVMDARKGGSIGDPRPVPMRCGSTKWG